MKKPDTRCRMVARYLALGIPLAEVCTAHGLNPTSWRVIVSSPMFQTLLTEVNQEIDERVAEEAVGDPTLATLRVNSLKAAQTLAGLVDKGDSDSVKIKAADSILDRTGYGREHEKPAPSVIFLELSAEKLAIVTNRFSFTRQPEHIKDVRTVLAEVAA